MERSLNLGLNDHAKQNPWLVILDKRFTSFEPQFHYLTSEKSNPHISPLSHISQFFHGINEIRYLAEPCRKKVQWHTGPAHSFYRWLNWSLEVSFLLKFIILSPIPVGTCSWNLTWRWEPNTFIFGGVSNGYSECRRTFLRNICIALKRFTVVEFISGLWTE